MTLNVGGQMTVEGAVELMTELLADLVGTAVTAHLYKSSFVPGAGSVEADFVAGEADYSGYAAQAVTWGAVAVASSGRVIVFSDNLVFQTTTAVVPNIIGGAWLEVNLGGGPPAVHKSLIYFQFAEPIVLGTPLQALGLKFILSLPDMSGVCIIEP